VHLSDNARAFVHTRDAPDADSNGQRGIVAALTRWPADDPPRLRIDRLDTERYWVAPRLTTTLSTYSPCKE
jgi:hypothetical protein